MLFGSVFHGTTQYMSVVRVSRRRSIFDYICTLTSRVVRVDAQTRLPVVLHTTRVLCLLGSKGVCRVEAFVILLSSFVWHRTRRHKATAEHASLSACLERNGVHKRHVFRVDVVVRPLEGGCGGGGRDAQYAVGARFVEGDEVAASQPAS